MVTLDSSTDQKLRLDLAVVERGLCDTRSRARALILAGDIMLNGAPAMHAGTLVRFRDEIAIKSRPRFVSRGGEKLEHALEVFAVDASGIVCADLGASTGGFTDCLRQRGASRIYAVDVGYGQIDQSLRDDVRVVVMERINARYLNSLPELVDLVVIDVSFISLALILPVAIRLLKPGGTCVPLIKPQFEAGRKDVGKGGVVRNPEVHRRVLAEVCGYAIANGFRVSGLVRSPLLGPSGNVEFLGHFTTSQENGSETETVVEVIDRVVTTE